MQCAVRADPLNENRLAPSITVSSTITIEVFIALAYG
jgi:hypothetical protein